MPNNTSSSIQIAYTFGQGPSDELATKARCFDAFFSAQIATAENIEAIFDNADGGPSRTFDHYMCMLLQIAKYLEATGFSETGRQELGQFMYGLKRLKEGEPPRFLKPGKSPRKGGPTPADPDKFEVKARLLIAVHYLHTERRRPREESVEMVAEAFGNYHIFISPKSLDFATTLGDDYDSFTATTPRIKSEIANSFLDDYADTISAIKLSCEYRNIEPTEKNIFSTIIERTQTEARKCGSQEEIDWFNTSEGTDLG